MATSFRKFLEGLRIIPKTSSTASEQGDLDVTSAAGKLNYHNGTSSSPVVTEAHSATLTNKTIDTAGPNTLKVNGNTLSASAGTATVTIPNSTDTLVGRATTDTLTNKSLSDSTTAIVDATDPTKQIAFDAAGTSGTKTTLTGSQTVNRVLTLPDATDTIVGKATTDNFSNKTIDTANSNTVKINGNSLTASAGTATITVPNSSDTLVGRATTDTLTNKTFDAQGTGNSLTNITDTNIKTGANINRAKIASGTANHVIINDAGGALSSEATLAISRGGTGQATKTTAFDALSPLTTAGDVIVHNGTNNIRLPRGTDGQVLVVDNNQTNKLKWTTLQQGAKNYIVYGTFENNDAVTGWSLSHSNVDANTRLPTQASGSWTAAAGTLSKSIVSSGQLAGSYSLSLASSGATTAGDMLVTDALTLDLEAQASVQTFSFFYKIVSGAANGVFSGTSSNSIGVAIYVVDGSLAGTWIQPAGVFNIVQTSGVGKAAGTFQVPSDATQVRLAVYFPNATSGAITVYLDDFVLGPQVVQYGAPVTDWVDFPSVAAGTLITAITTSPTYGTVAYNKAQWRRVGSDMEIRWDFRQTTAGTAGSGTYLFNLPPGLSIDTNKVSVSSSNDDSKSLGVFDYNDQAGSIGTGYVTAHSSTQLRMVMQAQSGSTSYSVGTIGSTYGQLSVPAAGYAIKARVPILGWSSSVQMSNDTDTRVVAASVGGGSGVAATNTTVQLLFGTTNLDTHAGIGTNQYTVPVSGYYRVSCASRTQFNANNVTFNHSLNIYKNTSVAASDVLQGDGGNQNALYWMGAFVDSVIQCNAGDVITVKFTTNFNAIATTSLQYFSINRLSGPSAIAASETVAARYYTTAGPVINNTSPTITYGTKVYDSHGAMSGSTYTIPVSGKYRVTLRFLTPSTAFGANTAIEGYVVKNGVINSALGNARVSSAVTTQQGANGSATFDALAGDLITIKIYSDQATTLATAPVGSDNYVCIERIGN